MRPRLTPRRNLLWTYVYQDSQRIVSVAIYVDFTVRPPGVTDLYILRPQKVPCKFLRGLNVHTADTNAVTCELRPMLLPMSGRVYYT